MSKNLHKNMFLCKKYVYVVYDLRTCLTNTYTPPTICFTINYTRISSMCTCLAFNSKKNHTCNLDITNQGYKIYGSFMPSLCLRYAFALPSLQVRYTSVTKPFQIRSLEQAKNGSYKGLTQESLGTCRKHPTCGHFDLEHFDHFFIVCVYASVKHGLIYSARAQKKQGVYTHSHCGNLLYFVCHIKRIHDGERIVHRLAKSTR